MIDPNSLIWLPIIVVCFVAMVVMIIYLAHWVQENDDKGDNNGHPTGNALSEMQPRTDVVYGEAAAMDAHIPAPRSVHPSEVLVLRRRSGR